MNIDEDMKTRLEAIREYYPEGNAIRLVIDDALDGVLSSEGKATLAAMDKESTAYRALARALGLAA